MPAHRTAGLACFLSVATIPLAACSATHGPQEDIASGVYALTIHTEADGCAPARLSGEVGEVPVVSQPGLLSVPVPDRADDPSFEVSRRVTLREDQGFHYEVSAGMEECPTAVTRHSWTVVDRSEGSFEVEHVQRYDGLSGCGPMEDAPAADCEAVRDLRFELRSRCEAPCGLTWSPSVGVVCTC